MRSKPDKGSNDEWSIAAAGLRHAGLWLQPQVAGLMRGRPNACDLTFSLAEMELKAVFNPNPTVKGITQARLLRVEALRLQYELIGLFIKANPQATKISADHVRGAKRKLDSLAKRPLVDHTPIAVPTGPFQPTGTGRGNRKAGTWGQVMDLLKNSEKDDMI
ncbi:MAG: hypothetical protein Q9219_006480 [cf. Caloplaca sp. 3 TL-2023]